MLEEESETWHFSHIAEFKKVLHKTEFHSAMCLCDARGTIEVDDYERVSEILAKEIALQEENIEETLVACAKEVRLK